MKHFLQRKNMANSIVEKVRTANNNLLHFHFKYIIPKEISSHLINHYGDSEWQLLVRVSEHLSMTPLTEKRVQNLKQSAIINHILLQAQLAFAWSKITIETLEQGVKYVQS